MDLHFLTIAQAAGLIAALDSQLDSFVTLTPDRAEAKSAEAAIMANGPLGPCTASLIA